MRRKMGILLLATLTALWGCSGSPDGSEQILDAGGADTGDTGPSVAKIWMSCSDLRLAYGDTAQVDADPRDRWEAPVEDAAVEWRSSDDTVVTVDQSGRAEAVGVGEADIEAAVGDVVGSCHANVYEPVDTAEIISPDAPLRPGERAQAELRVTGVLGHQLDPNDFDVNWWSDDEDVLVHRDGAEFVALRPGASQITAFIDGVHAKKIVEVGDYADLVIRLIAERWQVHEGESMQVRAKVFGPGGDVALPHVDVQWTSDDASIASITDDGTVTGHTLGRTEVIASAHGSSRAAAMTVIGTYSDLDAGRRHVCGIYSGIAVCWGADADGQLGDGEHTSQPRPVPVGGGHDFVDIAAGDDFSCALDTDGRAFCWGANDHGQLGDGTHAPHATPVAVATDTPFEAITAGFAHACALDADGEAFCWGRGDDGRLGTGVYADAAAPTAVAGDHRFAAIDAGEHTCAVIAGSGEPWCWGDNEAGEIGAMPKITPADSDGTGQSAVPLRASSRQFASVRAGDDFSCALTDDAQVYCWGDNHDDQLGRTIYSDFGGGVVTILSEVSWPEPLHQSRVDYIALDAGYHPCAIRDGAPYCWREDFHGDPTASGHVSVPSPVRLTGIHEARQITTGYRVSCAVDALGDAYCSGWGTEGVLGHGSLEEYSRRAFVPVSRPALAVFQ